MREEGEENMDNGLKVVESGLVPVYETSTGERVVYGTELHEALGVRRDFTTWIKGRLCECDAVELDDFEAFPQNGGKPNGGRPKHEYILKLDIAKEMAMLERNEKGKQVRRYFIQVEKRYKVAQRAVVDQAEQLAAFMDWQEAFNRAVMDQLGSLELRMMEGSQRYPSRFLGSAMEERMKELNRLIDQVAVLTGMERNRVLHFMYNALQEHLGISLDPYLFVFREESGDENACPLHVIASNDRFYEVAVAMNQSVIDRKKLYG